MFICGKPIRFEYNIWWLCGENSYPYHLSFYTGENENKNVAPLGTRFVQGLVVIMIQESMNFPLITFSHVIVLRKLLLIKMWNKLGYY